jgi:hypothetical protein
MLYKLFDWLIYGLIDWLNNNKILAVAVHVQIDLSDEDKEVGDVVNLVGDDKYCPTALDKMIQLITTLVEKSRRDGKHLHLSDRDRTSLLGGKVGCFKYCCMLHNVIRYYCCYYIANCNYYVVNYYFKLLHIVF